MDRQSSVVVVTVPAAEPVVGPWRAELDQSAAWGVPAHITVLFPFVAAEQLDAAAVARLAAAVASVPAFHLTLDSVAWFGDEVVYLAPHDDGPFRALTAAVGAAFGGLQPYGGQYGPDPVPHLTVGHGHPRARLQEAADAVQARLPIEADIADAVLMTGVDAPNAWSVHTVLHLGEPRR